MEAAVQPLILVAGGAGYIGSHTAVALQEAGFRTLVLDDFSTGHRAALRGGAVVEIDLLDREAVRAALAVHRPAAVVHFAARCYVGESMQDPGLYYRNNVGGTLNLLEAMVAAQVGSIVFSSTCATYGIPDRVPIEESCPQRPINPYGNTKLACEWLLRDFAAAHGVDVVALRYFNAAGADPAGRLGEDHRPETHLIPLALAAAAGRRGPLQVYGDDYPTPDGTCIRDYVHVADLADAHVLAVQSLLGGEGGFRAYNLGNGNGASVAEVVATCGRVVGRAVPHVVAARRPGDPPRLVGSTARIERELGWRPRRSDLAEIVATAWAWMERHPDGYAD
ncbi:MAG: UDP-glucose 4-epimerase GalE [Planctomycetes bacterium]|nr:UDP-glucose 4-epimerase GalE [Planctomycetota bacterium]